MKKLAVFIAGPYRYVDLLVKQFDTIMKSVDIDYDYFIHLWKEDLGNKKRINESNKINFIQSNERLKYFIYQKPYNADMYKESLGYTSGSHSVNHAIIGMFLSMSLLSNSLKMLPDCKDYTHILRLRTDVLFLNSNIFELVNWNSNNIFTSRNYRIPPEWISDHLFLSKRNIFFRFWSFKNVSNIIRSYQKSGKNPERMLMHINEKLINRYKVVDFLVRYKDFHVVYNPPKDDDPDDIKNILVSNNVKYLYTNWKILNTSNLHKFTNDIKCKNNEKYNNFRYNLLRLRYRLSRILGYKNKERLQKSFKRFKIER